jgi:hypothetical protein
MCQQPYYTWCKPKPPHKKPCECDVKVENEIEVKQKIEDLKGGNGGDGGAGGPSGPGGDGGDGGTATATQNATAAISNQTSISCGALWQPVPTSENKNDKK